jgi:hypothetical protein
LRDFFDEDFSAIFHAEAQGRGEGAWLSDLCGSTVFARGIAQRLKKGKGNAKPGNTPLKSETPK